jgi:hypothetical protein
MAVTVARIKTKSTHPKIIRLIFELLGRLILEIMISLGSGAAIILILSAESPNIDFTVFRFIC